MGDVINVSINNSGVPSGGTTGQLLGKKSGLSYDLEWLNAGSSTAQTLSLGGAGNRELSISGGNTVTLPVGNNSVITNFSLTGNILTLELDNASPVTVDLSTIGITTAQSNAIVANTNKVGITTGQANEISANTLKIGLTDGSVTTARISDNAVTTAKISSNAVTTVKILDANITTAKIADNAITTAKILNGTILEQDLEPAVITKLNQTGIQVIDITQAAFDLLTTAQKGEGTYFILPTAPTGYTVDITQANIDASNQDAVGFSILNAEVGAYFDYTFSTSGDAQTVSGFGTITNATQVFTGINLTALADGTITLTVLLTNGNVAGSNVTDTVVKSTVVETLLTGTIIFENAAGSQANAFDGNTDTFFFSADFAGLKKRIGLDLGAGNEKSITRVRFFPRGGFFSRMHDVDIEVSNDNVNYTTVANTGTNAIANQWYEYSFTPTAQFRYVRFTKVDVNTSFNFNEAEIYGQ